jgi:hypothetical protein
MRERRGERAQIEAALGPDERLEVPAEAAGVTTGRVLRGALAHYFLQEVGTGTNVRHDRALCALPDALAKGALVTIRYRDGYGTLEEE